MRFMGDAPLKGQSELDVLCTLLKVSPARSVASCFCLALCLKARIMTPKPILAVTDGLQKHKPEGERASETEVQNDNLHLLQPIFRSTMLAYRKQ